MATKKRAAERKADETPGDDEPEYVDSASDERLVNNPPGADNVMRSQYRVLRDREKEQMGDVKAQGALLWEIIDSLGDSEEITVAKQKAREAVMWAVNHITR